MEDIVEITEKIWDLMEDGTEHCPTLLLKDWVEIRERFENFYGLLMEEFPIETSL